MEVPDMNMTDKTLFQFLFAVALRILPETWNKHLTLNPKL